MSTFEFISVAISIVVGLAVAQTLRGVVLVFRDMGSPHGLP